MRIFLQSRARLFFLGCVVVAGYFTYTAVDGAIQTHRVGNDREAAAQEIARLEAKKAHIEAVKRYVASDAYVEQEARRTLGYARDGEVPFVVISPEPERATAATGEWWERLFPR